jgi:hypothetical protein
MSIAASTRGAMGTLHPRFPIISGTLTDPRGPIGRQGDISVDYDRAAWFGGGAKRRLLTAY